MVVILPVRLNQRRLGMKTTFLVLGLLSGAAHAADLAACKQIGDSSQRLACYDQLASDGVAPSSAPDLAVVQAGTVAPAAAAVTETVALATPASSSAPAPLASGGDAFSKRWELDPTDQTGIFGIRPHQPVYIMPVSWRESVNRQPCSANPRNCAKRSANSFKNVEAKFQLSFKTTSYGKTL
jgi:phospholipase A1